MEMSVENLNFRLGDNLLYDNEVNDRDCMNIFVKVKKHREDCPFCGSTELSVVNKANSAVVAVDKPYNGKSVNLHCSNVYKHRCWNCGKQFEDNTGFIEAYGLLMTEGALKYVNIIDGPDIYGEVTEAVKVELLGEYWRTYSSVESDYESILNTIKKEIKIRELYKAGVSPIMIGINEQEGFNYIYDVVAPDYIPEYIRCAQVDVDNIDYKGISFINSGSNAEEAYNKLIKAGYKFSKDKFMNSIETVRRFMSTAYKLKTDLIGTLWFDPVVEMEKALGF